MQIKTLTIIQSLDFKIFNQKVANLFYKLKKSDKNLTFKFNILAKS